MPDKEKVIKGLEICTKDIPMSNAVHKSNFCKECPYYNTENRYCWNQIVMMRDALALLKEQEALPIVYRENQFTGLPVAHCPSCDECLLQFHAGAYGKETKFCYYCGQAVKWND